MSSKLTIDERFERFVQDNPEILESLIKLAVAAIARGYRRYSIKGLWEVLRYRADPVTAERYKLPNEFTSRYARLVMASDERLRGFFVIRTITANTEDEDDGFDEFRDYH